MAGENVSFPSDNSQGDMVAVVFGDPSKNKKGLIVIHEWWGMNDQIKKQGGEMAAESGLVVLVPDMYRGKVTADFEEAGHLMGGLDWPGALQDIAACSRYLVSRGCGKVGVTGFCMGGALSIAAAAKVPEISAASAFYGLPKADVADVTTIKIPLQGHFAEKDTVAGFSSPADFRPFNEKLKAAGVNYEHNTYDAGHAFTNPSNRIGPAYNEEARNLAMSRLFAFMHKHLA